MGKLIVSLFCIADQHFRLFCYFARFVGIQMVVNLQCRVHAIVPKPLTNEEK